jgi:hypothetical protein
VDGLKELTSLRHLDLSQCDELTNVDGLRGLTTLQTLDISRCRSLKKEQIDKLHADLKNTKILQGI